MKVKATILTLKLVLFLAFADLVLNLFVVITIMTVIMIIILKSIYFYMALRTSTSSTSAFSKLLFYFHVIIRLLNKIFPKKTQNIGPQILHYKIVENTFHDTILSFFQSSECRHSHTQSWTDVYKGNPFYKWLKLENIAFSQQTTPFYLFSSLIHAFMVIIFYYFS